MPIQTGVLTFPRIQAFRTSDECQAFVDRFIDYGFTCEIECSRASCGFYLVHYAYRPIEPIGPVDSPSI